MANIITIIILVLILGGAIRHIIKLKKSGVKCIGCPSAGCCSSNKCNCNNNQ